MKFPLMLWTYTLFIVCTCSERSIRSCLQQQRWQVKTRNQLFAFHLSLSLGGSLDCNSLQYFIQLFILTIVHSCNCSFTELFIHSYLQTPIYQVASTSLTTPVWSRTINPASLSFRDKLFRDTLTCRLMQGGRRFLSRWYHHNTTTKTTNEHDDFLFGMRPV